MGYASIDRERVLSAARVVVSVGQSAARLLGALAYFVLGALGIAASVLSLREPDSLLLQQAVDDAVQQHEPLPESAPVLRDHWLLALAAATVCLLMSINSIRAWWRGTPKR